MPTRGDLVIAFIETYCVIPEGRDAGKPVRLRGWQKNAIRKIYDNPFGTRLAIISMARKNGKTALIAMLLLAHLVGPESRLNTQLYSTAQSREQASLVFSLAAKMVRMSSELEPLVKVADSGKTLFCPMTGVRYRALSAEHTTAMGLSPALAIHDELGEVRGPKSDLYSAVESGMGAHDEPLSIVISTQAATNADLLSTLIDDAATGRDPHTVLVFFQAPKDAAIDDEEAWAAANPALGDFLSLKEMRKLAADAAKLPAFEANFRNRNLNQRVAATASFLSPDVWELNAGTPDLSAFEDYPSWWGLDLSSRLDLTALVGVAATPDGLLHVACHFWTPEEGLAGREDRDRAPYTLWRKQGFLTATPGRSVDYSFVATWLVEFAARMPFLQAIAFDRYRIEQFKRELTLLEATLPLVEWGQGFISMAPALDVLEAAALTGTLRHGGHPVLTWNAANAIVTKDAAGNRKLDKSKATGRIDGLQSLAMAMGIRAKGVVGELPAGPSPWETEGYVFQSL